MNTTSIKKPKIDFKAWTKDDKVQPRTLREIHAEVGFPFTAKTATPGAGKYPNPSIPVGVCCCFTHLTPHAFFVTEQWQTMGGVAHVDGDVPRWILLGAL